MTVTQLPTWEQMSDLDKGAALLHVWKVAWAGEEYARERCPAEYFDDPVLLALTRDAACDHAMQVTDGHEAIIGRIGRIGHARLYNLALNAEGQRNRRRSPQRVRPPDLHTGGPVRADSESLPVGWPSASGPASAKAMARPAAPAARSTCSAATPPSCGSTVSRPASP